MYNIKHMDLNNTEFLTELTEKYEYYTVEKIVVSQVSQFSSLPTGTNGPER